MATVNKDFKLKNGLVVEGTNATVNGYDILTKKEADQNYIIGLIGGSATPLATPDTVVLRDENADFSAGTITADLVGDVTGTVSDISNHTTDSLAEGVNNEYYTDAKVRDVLTTATKTNITITEIGNELHITAENGVADSTTDDLTEGTNHLYFTNQRALDATSTAYDAAGAATTAENNAKSYADGLAVNYDPAGSADTVQGNLEDHASDTITHGVTGHIVGTSDVQTLTNKTIGDTLNFVDGFGNIQDPNKITIDGTNLGIYASHDLSLTSGNGNILISADSAAYYGSASAENELATHGYVDNAVSGLAWKQAVNLLWNDPNATLTGATGTLIIDGHSALGTGDAGYRILITTGTNRGIWEYADNGSDWTLTRPADADTYSELIGAAVYVMEGTQFGSTSWVQGNHYSTSFTDEVWTQFSGQGSVTAGTGIIVDGLQVSVDTDVIATQTNLSDGLALKQDNLSEGLGINIVSNEVAVDLFDIIGPTTADYLDLSAKLNKLALKKSNLTAYTDTLYDAIGAASTAEFNAKAYADGLAVNYDAAGSATTAYNDAVAYADNLTTDDVEEGTVNHYYTDARAKAEAAALLVNATKSNITITADVNDNLTITAENGVADSTTDDLAEGSTNLYFTDSRALGAVSGADITPNTVTIDTYRKEEGTQQYVSSASTVNVHSFGYPYESVKYLVRVVGWDGGVKHSQITEILMTVDGNNNIAITEYGNVHTGTNPLATFSATYNVLESSYKLTATTAVSGCEIIAAATMLSWAD